MGLYDREYYQRDEPAGISLGAQRSIVTNLLIVNVGVYLADILLFDGGLSLRLAMTVDTLAKPWYWWRMITAGFAHDHKSIGHILGNMFVLFMFGRHVEGVYGRAKFLKLYLVMIVFSMLVWALTEQMFGNKIAICVGASGAVSGIIILFALHFPRQKVLLFLVIPAPAWVFGALIIAGDMFGFTRTETNVAHSAHLAGMALAAGYFVTNRNPGRQRQPLTRYLFKRGPKLRVHTPDDSHGEIDGEADRILDKWHRDGAESLTPRERQILEDYSRRMRQKHR